VSELNMGNLAGFLQSRFVECCPAGWNCRSEVRVLDRKYEQLLGFAPRVDVLLERDDGQRRLWIEFEVSRADPVANHAKFATSHLFQPQADTDAFVAMVSSHVARGRRNLAASTVFLMRHIHMKAFQTVLLPQFEPATIKQLNHLPLHQLASQQLDTRAEIQRAILVSEPVLASDHHRIHFAGDLLDVFRNLQRWNDELSTADGRQLWKKRTVVYFVFDPNTRLFAPCKFCAFLDTSLGTHTAANAARFVMTVNLYATLDESERRFDGNRAQTHLAKNLGMKIVEPADSPAIQDYFTAWLEQNAAFIAVHPRGPRFLVPPTWFK
jgi:hypothetical protein